MSTPPTASPDPQAGAAHGGTGPTSSTGTAFKPDRRFWLVYACLMTVMFLTTVYHTVVATALPTIVGDLGGVTHMSWALTAYTIAQTISMPATGKLGDLLGRKRIYIIGILVFLTGSTLCGLAPSMPVFAATRFVQGLGGGVLLVSAQAITGDLIPPRVRGRYMAPLGAVFGVAALLGPLVGGWITDTLGWRWVFWVFLPVGIGAWAAIAVALELPVRVRVFRVDWAGLMLSAAGATGIVLLVTWGGTVLAWTSPTTAGLAAATVGAWALLVRVERRAADPVLPPRVLTDHTFVVATVVSTLMAGCMFGIYGYLPTYLQMVHGVAATASGLVLVPGSLGNLVGALISGNLVTRTGRYRAFPVIGCLVAAAGMTMLALAPATAPLWWLGAAVFVLQAGIGMFLQLSILIIQNALPATMLGAATSTNNFFRQIGISVGNATVGVLLSARLTAALVDIGLSRPTAAAMSPAVLETLDPQVAQAVRSAYADAFSPVLLGLVPVLLLAAGVALRFRPLPLSTRTGLEMIEDELAAEGP